MPSVTHLLRRAWRNVPQKKGDSLKVMVPLPVSLSSGPPDKKDRPQNCNLYCALREPDKQISEFGGGTKL